MARKLIATCLVLLLAVPVAAEEQEKVIYLTFDDGPGVYTAQLLDTLEKHDVKATFFLVNTGYHMEQLLRRMVAQGHSVGIHSNCHDFKTIYSSEWAYMEDLHSMETLIMNITDTHTNLVRFPGGSSNTVSRRYCDGIMSRLTRRLEEEGYVYFDWNVDSGDGYGCHDPEIIYQKVICGIRGKKQAVILQHDVNGCSVKTVERIILWGKANGYCFRALTAESPACRHNVQN